MVTIIVATVYITNMASRLVEPPWSLTTQMTDYIIEFKSPLCYAKLWLRHAASYSRNVKIEIWVQMASISVKSRDMIRKNLNTVQKRSEFEFVKDEDETKRKSVQMKARDVRNRQKVKVDRMRFMN